MKDVFAAAGWRLDRVEAAFEGRSLREDDVHMVLLGSVDNE